MAGYFNVQKALQSGKSQTEIDAYMSQKGLMPSPAGTTYTGTPRPTASAAPVTPITQPKSVDYGEGYYNPKVPMMPTTPYQEEEVNDNPFSQIGGELASGAGTFADEFSKIFFSRANKLAKETYADTRNQLATGKFKTASPVESVLSGAGPIAQLGVGALGRAINQPDLARADESLQKVAPAAGEALMYALPIGQAGAISRLPTALGRIGASSLVSGVAGGIHGATTEGLTSVERLKQMGIEGATAAITAGLITGTIEGGKLLAQKTLKPLARFIANRVMRPDIGNTGNWSKNMQEASDIMLNETEGITPEQVARSANEKMAGLTKRVEEGLKRSKATYTSQKAQEMMGEALDENIPLLRQAQNISLKSGRGAMSSDLTDAMKEMRLARNDLVSMIDRVAQQKGGLPQEQTLDATDMFNIKQNLGGMTRKIWERVRSGTPVSPSDEVYLEGYQRFLDMVDGLAPDTSALTHIQHQLHNIISGAYSSMPKIGGASYGLGRVVMSAVGQPLIYGAAKGLNTLGGTNPVVNQALQTLGGGITAATVAKSNQMEQ